MSSLYCLYEHLNIPIYAYFFNVTKYFVFVIMNLLFLTINAKIYYMSTNKKKNENFAKKTS